MVESTSQSVESGRVALKSSDGETIRVSLDVAVSQSSFIAEYIENEEAEFADQVSNAAENLTLNEVSIDLSE